MFQVDRPGLCRRPNPEAAASRYWDSGRILR